MTQEEKAKAYDKVRKKIAIRFGSNVADEIFSQFEMSEDERIRKEIISALKFANVKGVYDEHIAWLEKQGEEKEYTFKSIPRLLDMIEPTDRAKAYCQKLIDTLAKEGYNIDTKVVEDVLKGWNGEDVPMAVMDEQKPVNDTDEDIVEAVKDISILDMVEPKFKVGDWIVYYRNDSSREILYVYDIRDGRYYLNDNIHLSWSVKECDEKCHLWTIKDAKDGDVLVSELCGTIMLYKGIEDNNIQFYCDYDFSDIDVPGDRFAINNGQNYGSVDDSDDWHPATKEQRDLLFSKMNEAGYEWDADKKEVKLLITNGGDFETENCEQKPDWSEKDEDNMILIEDWLSDYLEYTKEDSSLTKHEKFSLKEDVIGYVDWLKSLKERIKHK